MFSLTKSEDIQNKLGTPIIQWDLVLAASWFEEDKFRRLSSLTEKILWGLDVDFFTQFSAIINIEPDWVLAPFLITVPKRKQARFWKARDREKIGLFVWEGKR